MSVAIYKEELGLVGIKFLTGLLVLGFLVTSCTAVKNTTNFVKTELYFGLSGVGGTEISPAQWNEFKTTTLNKNLSGYTEVDSKGFWTNAKNQSISQKSKIIIYLNKGSDSDSLAIEKIIAEYKEIFNQESVLKINYRVNGRF